MSAEYGWTDEYIDQIPLCTFRQKVAAIQRRNFSRNRVEAGRISWQTRQIASFIAGGYMVGKGKPNPALEHAGKISLDDVEVLLLGGELPGRPVENKNGSYERFMTRFGGGPGALMERG